MDKNDIITPDNWDLDFYKPEDLLGRDQASSWAKRSAAAAANTAAKSFFEKTGKRVNVNLNGPAGPNGEGTRRGTRNPANNPGVRNSRHLYGDAFDFQVQDLNDNERAEFLGHLQENGFKGFGFYTPEQGGHLHADFGKARLWGPVPTWAATRLKGSVAAGKVSIPYESRTAIDELAKTTGIDKRVAYAIAYAESGYNPRQRVGTSSSKGLYQMTDGNWRYLTSKYASKHPEIRDWNPDNPRHNALMMGYSINENVEQYKKTFGSDPKPADIYGMHFLGATGYKRMTEFVSKAGEDSYAFEGASEQAVRANRSVFFHKNGKPKTTAEFAQWLDRKASNAPGYDAADIASKSLVAVAHGRAYEPVSASARAAGEQSPSIGAVGEKVEAANAYSPRQVTTTEPGYRPLTPDDVLAPPIYTSVDASRAAEIRIKHAEDTPSLSTLFVDAVRDTNSLSWAFRGQPGMKPDPNFILREEELRATMDGVDPRYQNFIATSLSEEQLLARRAAALDAMGSEQRLAQAGLTGFGLQVVASILDPVQTVAAFTGVGAAGNIAKFANISGKLRGALMGSVANVAATGALQFSGDPRITGQDYAISAAAGAGLGALLARSSRLEAENIAIARGFADAIDARAKEIIDGAGAGAAVTKGADYVPPNISKAIDALENETVPKFAFGDTVLTLGAVESLMKSPNPASRLVGSYLGENAVGTKGYKVMPIAASERAKRIEVTNMARVAKVYREALSDYAKEKGTGAFGKVRLVGQFNDEVGMFIRERNPAMAENYSPAVKKAAQEIRKVQRELLELAKNPGLHMGKQMPGLKNADLVDADDHYMYRVWDHEKLRGLSQLDLEALLRNSIRKAQPDIDEKYLRRLTQGAAMKMKSRAHGPDLETFNRALDYDEDALRAVLRDTGMDGEELDDAIKALSKSKSEGDSGSIARMKRKMWLDENEKFIINGEERSVSDFLVNDGMSLFQAYNRQMSGRIAMAQTQIMDPKTGELIIDGIRSDADFNKVLEQVAARGKRDGVSAAQIEKDIKDLMFIYDYTTGRLQIPTGTFVDTLRLIRKYNFVRVMNQVGFAQLPEAAVTLSQVGWKASLEHMPALRRIVGMKPEYVKSYGIVDELEAFMGVGSQMDRGWVMSRMDDEATNGLRAYERGTAMAKTENVLENAQRVTSTVSGMSGITDMLTDWNARVMSQRFVDLAYGASRGADGKLTPATRNWLSSLGIDDERVMKYKVREMGKARVDWVKNKDALDLAIKQNKKLALDKMSEADAAIYHRTQATIDRMGPLDDLPESSLPKLERLLNDQKELLEKNGFVMPKVPKSTFSTIEGEGTMLDRIVNQIKSHAKTTKGMYTDNKVNLMSFDNWTDLEARDAFLSAMFRASRRMVQENDVGQMRRWMSEPVAATILQFRSFVMTAYAKQLLHNVHMARQGDSESLQRAFTYFMSTVVFGGMAFAAQTQLASIGRTDREEFMKKRIYGEDGNFAPLMFNAASRSGWSSLIPLVMDTGPSYLLAGEPLFNSRTTQQPSDAIFGNPTVGLGDSALSMFKTAGDMIHNDKTISQNDVRKAMQVLPFQNFWGVQNILNLMMSDLESK